MKNANLNGAYVEITDFSAAALSPADLVGTQGRPDNMKFVDLRGVINKEKKYKSRAAGRCTNKRQFGRLADAPRRRRCVLEGLH